MLEKSEELHNLYSSTSINRMIKSRSMGLVGTCSAHGGDEKCVQGFGWKA
jgi:hypothetical protein